MFLIDQASEGKYKEKVASTDDTLTLQSKSEYLAKETNWLNPEQTELLSREEALAYSISQFYLRRLLHTLNPQMFPNCYFINQRTITVEKRAGVQLPWENIGKAQQSVRSFLNQIGISLAHVDTTGSANFFLDHNQAVTYIDSVVNTSYFALLQMHRLIESNPTYFDTLPPEKLLKQFHYLVYCSTRDTSYVRTEIDMETLRQYVTQRNTDPKTNKKISSLINRLGHAYQIFPNLNKSKTREVLRNILNKNKTRMKEYDRTFDSFTYESLLGIPNS